MHYHEFEFDKIVPVTSSFWTGQYRKLFEFKLSETVFGE
jgi:hypothetical protein